MTDRYLFKAKRKMGEDWIEGYIYRFSEDEQPFIMVKNSFGEGYEVDETTICQFTGLYDGTKWEDLTEEEKQTFYEDVCSEDGKSIKYQNVEDVKHLWKGKKIWENDVVKEESCGYIGVVKYVDCQYLIDWNDFPYIRRDMMFWVEERGLKVVGTKFDNPELLGG